MSFGTTAGTIFRLFSLSSVKVTATRAVPCFMATPAIATPVGSLARGFRDHGGQRAFELLDDDARTGASAPRPSSASCDPPPPEQFRAHERSWRFSQEWRLKNRNPFLRTDTHTFDLHASGASGAERKQACR